MQIEPGLTIPEPNTWREILAMVGERTELRDQRVAVQEYGVSNRDLIAGLEARGADVTCVPVYRWTLPLDRGPILAALRSIAAGEVDVAIFTSSNQVTNVMQLADANGIGAKLRLGLAGMVIASIGPVCSKELRDHGIAIDIEPAHSRLGHLVKETAARSTAILALKRASASRSRSDRSARRRNRATSPAIDRWCIERWCIERW